MDHNVLTNFVPGAVLHKIVNEDDPWRFPWEKLRSVQKCSGGAQGAQGKVRTGAQGGGPRVRKLGLKGGRSC